jgi:hypothetical protein
MSVTSNSARTLGIYECVNLFVIRGSLMGKSDCIDFLTEVMMM